MSGLELVSWDCDVPEVHRDKTKESPWCARPHFPTSIATWEFQRVFPPLCPTLLCNDLMGLRSLFICSMSPSTTSACTCPLFKMQISQVAMAFKIYYLKITDTQREKGGHRRMEEFYFCLRFFARTVVRLSKGRCPHSQSWLHLCIWTVTLEESYEAFFQGILALPYFTKHTISPLLLPLPLFILPKGAQRTTSTRQVYLFSHHHLSSRLTALEQ